MLHVVNICAGIPRSGLIKDIYTNDIAEMEEIADRCILFNNMVKSMDVVGDM